MSLMAMARVEVKMTVGVEAVATMMGVWSLCGDEDEDEVGCGAVDREVDEQTLWDKDEDMESLVEAGAVEEKDKEVDVHMVGPRMWMRKRLLCACWCGS